MSKRITLVIDVGDNAAVEYFREQWNPDQLAHDLAKTGKVEASVFIGRLEEAPESWACACVLAETHGLLGTLDAVGPAWFGHKRHDPGATNFLNVKRTAALQLKWPTNELNSTVNYVRTNPIAKPLPKMIALYLDAALRT